MRTRLAQLKKRLKQTGDSEPEQALIRIVIGLILASYFFLLPLVQGHSISESVQRVATIIALAFSISSVALFVEIIRNPVASPARRLIGAIIDLSALSLEMYLGGEEAVSLFVFYLWVILGNGFRFGLPYLKFSYGLSLLGFSAAAFFGNYLQSNQAYIWGIGTVVLLTPIYVSYRIQSLHEKMREAEQNNDEKEFSLIRMIHELRTPLKGVIRTGNLLRGTSLNLEQGSL